MIASHEAIAALIRANGDPKLGAHYAKVTEPELLTSIANDPSSLAELGQQVKVSAMLQAINMIRVTNALVLERLPNMAPKDIAFFYTKLLDNIANFTTAAPSNPPDPYDTLLKRLPAPVADAVDAILKQTATLNALEDTAAQSRPSRGQ